MNIIGKLSIENPSEEIISLDQAEFPHPWSIEQWQGLDRSQNKLFTWRENQHLLGFALFGTPLVDDVAHLYKILIRSERRGDGSSFLFWSAIKEKLRGQGYKSIYLEVESSNVQAIRFYEKRDFSLLRRSKAYYSNGDDALIMMLTL